LATIIGSVRRIAEFGCFSNILLLWCWLKKSIPFKLFLPLYIFVTFPCYASGSVYVLLAITISHFMSILLIKNKKDFNFSVSCILIFLCNIGFFFFFNQDRGIYPRSRVVVNSIAKEIKQYAENQLQQETHVPSKESYESKQKVQKIQPTLPDTLDKFNTIQKTRISRLVIWEYSLQKIYQNPILGNSFYIDFTNETRSYPHNVIVQGYMGLGVIGGSLFLLVFCIGICDSIFCLRNSSEFGWLALLFFVAIIKSLLWNNIITDHMLWFLLAALRTVSLNDRSYIKVQK
jgi:hypothetical protein